MLESAYGRAVAEGGEMNPRKIAVLCAVLVVGALSSPASADLQRRGDPQGDVAGGRLDIRRVALDHTDRRLTMRLLTWTKWTKASLEGGSKETDRYMAWAFDSTGGPAIDYGVVVDSENGRLLAYLVRVAPMEQPERLGEVANLRRDGKLVEVTIGRGRLNTRRGFVRWAAQTVWRDGPGCSSPCYDSRPEQPVSNEPTLLTHDL